MPHDGERIVFIRLGSLGDVVLTTPAVRAARKAFPAAHIAFMTATGLEPLYASNPHLDEVLTLDRNRSNRDWREMLRAVRALRTGHFEIAIDLQRKMKTAILTRMAGVPRRIGGTSLDTDRVLPPPGSHASEQALAALAPLGIDAATTAPEVYVSEQDRKRATEILANFDIHRGERSILGIFPGAGWRPRAWPPDRFAEVARWARDVRHAAIVLVGADKDRDLVQQIASTVGPPVAVFMNLPLGVLAGVLECCDRFLSNDTGPMHLAVAVGTPTVALFGPGDFARFAPRHAPHIAIREPIACSPCRQFRDHCANNACMQLIDVARVCDALGDQW